MVGGWPEKDLDPDKTTVGTDIDELVEISGCKPPLLVLVLPSLFGLPLSLSRYLSRALHLDKANIMNNFPHTLEIPPYGEFLKPSVSYL